MARISKASLLQINGKVGNLVVRKMNGKTFLSLRPDEYKPTKSIKLKNSRNNFATIVKLAKIIVKNKLLVKAWSASRLKGVDAYRKIIKANLKLTENGFLSEKNIIVPPVNKSVIKDVLISEDDIQVLLSKIPISKSASQFTPLTFIVIIYLFEPINDGSSEQHFLFFSEEMLKEGRVINIRLYDSNKKFIQKYKKCIIYSSILKNNQGYSKEWYYKTFSKSYTLK
jgi:hypothetical protein